MIIYFADRNLNITGQASTSLPGGFRIMEDLLTEEVDSGVNVFTCKITCHPHETPIVIGDYETLSFAHLEF